MKLNSYLSDQLTDEFKRKQALLQVQPDDIQRYLEFQGKQIAEAIIERRKQMHFSLPDRIVCNIESTDQPALFMIPQTKRMLSAGGFINRLRKVEIYKDLRHTLAELEQSPDRAVSVASSLVRHATVLHMVHDMLPSGNPVTYHKAGELEMIPSIPEGGRAESESASTTGSKAKKGGVRTKTDRSEQLISVAPFANKFYLPQWVAFDENGDLLDKSVEEAEADITSLQDFMEVLFLAVALAPYISADEEYTRKRYGVLGQLVNQGRTLAIYKTKNIISQIQERAAAGNINRGLSLSLPYFDDQLLRIDNSRIEVIPAGRIMFVPAFIGRAMRQEAVKVSQDTRLNPSTRKHLLYLLDLLEKAFENE